MTTTNQITITEEHYASLTKENAKLKDDLSQAQYSLDEYQRVMDVVLETIGETVDFEKFDELLKKKMYAVPCKLSLDDYLGLMANLNAI